ncbi:HET domain-containing protein [Fusarium sp. LHS14.1]|nr:HET domain-containing protein [Fusarium sp. LHS14.1]
MNNAECRTQKGGYLDASSTIRLLGSEDVSAGSSYTTLSHRWNTAQMPRLTSNHPVNFDINSLPYTFQEAIEITRESGSRYLRIDSLCINQNDPDDWEAQSAQMSMVYEHSICNLAATGAVVSGKGLYSSVEGRARDGNVIKFDIECSWNSTEASSS